MARVLCPVRDGVAAFAPASQRNASRPRLALVPAVARRPGWRKYAQLVPVAILLWALDAVDRFRAGAQATGLLHAAVIDRISDRAGGTAALVMNRWLAAHPLPAGAAAAYYIVLQVLITGIVGVLLLRSGIASFRLHRDALIVTGVIGLVVFWLYPVAPPRMLPGYHDIAAATVPFFSTMLESKAADQFAAFPSLHVTWALWVAMALRAMLRRPLWRILVWAYPALTALDVLATANHYMLDVIAAPVVLLLGYATAAALAAVARRRARHAKRATVMSASPAWAPAPGTPRVGAKAGNRGQADRQERVAGDQTSHHHPIAAQQVPQRGQQCRPAGRADEIGEQEPRQGQAHPAGGDIDRHLDAAWQEPGHGHQRSREPAAAPFGKTGDARGARAVAAERAGDAVPPEPARPPHHPVGAHHRRQRGGNHDD